LQSSVFDKKPSSSSASYLHLTPPPLPSSCPSPYSYAANPTTTKHTCLSPVISSHSSLNSTKNVATTKFSSPSSLSNQANYKAEDHQQQQKNSDKTLEKLQTLKNKLANPMLSHETLEIQPLCSDAHPSSHHSNNNNAQSKNTQHSAESNLPHSPNFSTSAHSNLSSFAKPFSSTLLLSSSQSNQHHNPRKKPTTEHPTSSLSPHPPANFTSNHPRATSSTTATARSKKQIVRKRAGFSTKTHFL